MKIAALGCLLASLIAIVPLARAADKVPATLNFKMKSLDGKDVDLSKYQGRVVLIVNTASK